MSYELRLYISILMIHANESIEVYPENDFYTLV